MAKDRCGSVFTLDSVDYLCCVDYYSDYFEIDRLSHKKDANAVMKVLQRHFTTHGIPEIVFSDNGPPFNSRTFAQFAKDYQFTHQTSSPEYPQSNGKIEATIKIAKNIIKKTKKTNGNVNLALLEWRNIPTLQKVENTWDAKKNTCRTHNIYVFKCNRYRTCS